jgi:predicted DNA-binding transcriptional regulator AlpA
MPGKPSSQRSPHERKLENATTKAPSEAGVAIHQRFGDRGSGDDDDSAAERAAKLDAKRAAKLHARRSSLVQCGFPIYIRYGDLEAAGIARNWPTLTRLIEEEGFPRGVMLSPNIRAWKLDDITAWLATRPIERKPVPTRWGGDRRIRAP